MNENFVDWKKYYMQANWADCRGRNRSRKLPIIDYIWKNDRYRQGSLIGWIRRSLKFEKYETKTDERNLKFQEVPFPFVNFRCQKLPTTFHQFFWGGSLSMAKVVRSLIKNNFFSFLGSNWENKLSFHCWKFRSTRQLCKKFVRRPIWILGMYINLSDTSANVMF